MTEQPLPLVLPRQTNPPPRPTRRDRCVLRRAAEMMAQDVILWFGDDWDDDHEGLIEQLAEAMALSLDSDGYQIARYLENNFHWEPNAELVEILDGHGIYEAHDELVAKWVEINGVQADRCLGDMVGTRHGVGPIVGIDKAHATYTVQTDEYLHDHPNQKGKGGGYVIEFERALPQPAPENVPA